MPYILVKTKHQSLIPMLYQGRKPGYELVQLRPDEHFDTLLGSYLQQGEIHAVIIDCDLTDPSEIHGIKGIMDDAMFPVILISPPGNEITAQQAGMWLSCGVSDIFQLPMPAPLMGKRLGSCIQLYCVTQSLHGQVTDKLTGLHNRSAFYHFARRMMDAAPSDSYTVIISDIDNFKRINERFGEASGDSLLSYIGNTLNKMNSEDCLFARYGGDQFVGIMRTPVEHAQVSEEFMEQAMAELYSNAPIAHFTVQFGIYTDVDTSLPVSIMCDRALLALKTIKHQYGRNVGTYTIPLQQKFTREQQIQDSMEQALRENQFDVYYQPKHDIATSSLTGAEALVRWNHPVYGFMSPADFIPLFEQSGFISELDKYVWTRVCSDIRKTIDSGLPVVPVSVNTSRRDFLKGDLIDFVESCIKSHELDTSLLHMELTETAYMADMDIVTPQLNQLRECGIKIELDDFGTGMSSLGSISQLPVDIIKLDISLIRNIETQPAIVDSVIHLMHRLDYEVTAEGVDNDIQVALLSKMGCDCVQGYYYSKPLTYDGFLKYMSSIE